MGNIELLDGTEYGVCERCGCTDEEPCIAGNGETCSWVDEYKNLCTFCLEDTEYDSDMRLV